MKPRRNAGLAASDGWSVRPENMKTENKIFGYEWSDIQRAQQRGSLTYPVKTGNQNASVQCFRCLKFFRLPQTLGTDPWPVQCLHCDYMHTSHDGDSAMWPRWDDKKWVSRY